MREVPFLLLALLLAPSCLANHEDSDDPLQWLRDSVPGEPGVDYPIFAEVEETGFDCAGRVHGGYYADVDMGCQGYHVCLVESGEPRKVSFLCPNGTIFNQGLFTCEWWFNVDCTASEGQYGLNELIGDEDALAAEDEGEVTRPQRPRRPEPRPQQPRRPEPSPQRPSRPEPRPQQPRRPESRPPQVERQEERPARPQAPRTQQPQRQQPRPQQPKPQAPRRQQPKPQTPRRQQPRPQQPKQQTPRQQPKPQTPRRQQARPQAPRQQPKPQEPRPQQRRPRPQQQRPQKRPQKPKVNLVVVEDEEEVTRPSQRPRARPQQRRPSSRPRDDGEDYSDSAAQGQQRRKKPQRKRPQQQPPQPQQRPRRPSQPRPRRPQPDRPQTNPFLPDQQVDIVVYDATIGDDDDSDDGGGGNVPIIFADPFSDVRPPQSPNRLYDAPPRLG